ncbi:MAG: response regulator transcription factor [Syntrophobacteraceae bacterium]
MCSVLIVEDNSVFCSALRNFLSAAFPSVEIEEASNGEEALHKFRILKPVLILMDIRLPDINGLVLTRMIKNICPDTEVILLTSHNIFEYREAGLRSGASHFVIKGSARVDDITTLVESILFSKNQISTPFDRSILSG